ncbi:uncharacterized protein [Physcomitrium patens]|uniref:uncharacterized protein isoform X5 n=1 Tax=Physcomitrium patens TaxID=3218 RepID=UPI003CCD54F4
MASDLPAGAFSKPSTIRAAADRSSNDLSPVLNDRDNVCCHRVIAFRCRLSGFPLPRKMVGMGWSLRRSKIRLSTSYFYQSGICRRFLI